MSFLYKNLALGLEQDVPEYDMDSEDELWINQQRKRLDLTPLKFEQMMDRLEKSSGQTVVTLNEAKALLKQDDEISIAVYDYWLNKRLKMVTYWPFSSLCSFSCFALFLSVSVSLSLPPTLMPKVISYVKFKYFVISSKTPVPSATTKSLAATPVDTVSENRESTGGLIK